MQTRRPGQDRAYIYALMCPIEGRIRYVGRSTKPYERFKQHTCWVRSWKRHARKKRLMPDYHIPVPNPRTSPKGAWLWALDKRDLVPRLVILEEIPAECGREAELSWTERLIGRGHRLTNGERRSLDARKKEERVMQEAIELGRELISHSARCDRVS